MAELGHHLRQEMSDLRHGLELKIEGMRSEIHASAGSISRQMYGALLGQMAVLLGMPTFSWHTSGVELARACQGIG